MHHFLVLLLCKAPSLPHHPALVASPRPCVLSGCSWQAGTAAAVADLDVMLAGIWTRAYFHGQAPHSEESLWVSEWRASGRVRMGLLPAVALSFGLLGSSSSFSWTQPQCRGIAWQSAGVLGAGVGSDSFCMGFGSGFGNDFPDVIV